MKIHLAIFTIGLLFGLILSFIYRTALGNAPTQVINNHPTKALEKEVAKSEASYSKKVDSLKGRSAKLQKELSNTKTELTKSKQKSYSLQLAVYDLLDKESENKQADSLNTLASCDSLRVTVEQFMESSQEKDSLYEQVAINLEDQLRNKDSTIELKEKQYTEIKAAFTESIENSNELSAQNTLLTRQVKRQKLKNKVLSAAFFILTGAVANYIIHH